MPDTPTFGRYAEIPYEQMTPEQQEGYRLVKEVRGQVGGPSKIWVHNPKLAKAAAPLGAHFHPGHYSLTEREREIAVCIINSKWHSAYPTAAHERRGKEVGLPAEKVEALLSGLPASFTDEREQIVYEMATALANSHWVSKSGRAADRAAGVAAGPAEHQPNRGAGAARRMLALLVAMIELWCSVRIGVLRELTNQARVDPAPAKRLVKLFIGHFTEWHKEAPHA